jgi:hypothetical protein
MCGGLINLPTSAGICKDCWDKDEELFNRARAAMRFGEKLLPEDLSAKTGIDMKHIQRWTNQGRFG